MKYRAKITDCRQTIGSIYDLYDGKVRKDKYDEWLEVDTEEEAEIIEEINRLQAKAKELYTRLFDIYIENR